MDYVEFKIKILKPTRKWFRSSTRTLLVLMLGVGVGALITRICQQPDWTFNPPVKWGALGLNVSPVARNQLPPSSKYRGGLRIVDVRPGGPAARNGIRKGDILVGLHKWEMAEPAGLDFVMRKIEVENMSSMKFYVLRGDETLYGHIQLK